MHCTVFQGDTRIASGSLAEIFGVVKNAIEPVIIFDDVTGRSIDIDTRGFFEEPTRGRGRPKLGVVAREVTLLPRHWDWLNAQPGGASVTLRRLVETARKSEAERVRAAREAAYHFMSAIAGNRVNFEEASRALFAGDRERFAKLVVEWPVDIREHAEKLGFAENGQGLC